MGGGLVTTDCNKEGNMNWLEILLSVVIVAVGGGGIFNLIIKSRLEELRAIEERLSVERRKVYGEILDPYIELFASLTLEDGGASKSPNIIQKITSKEYRKAIFELGLIGSDDVIRAYNTLMQHSFKSSGPDEKDPFETMRLFGILRLEIRRSLGNKKTKLNELDMLRGEIMDIDKLEKQNS